ncbi:MAG TPA: AsmA-like C-terminal region-containing protein, partial [Stellaceae bacterium]|nr:AsmA-like C-terminal region-containing protein [Stellaceae bacterium]
AEAVLNEVGLRQAMFGHDLEGGSFVLRVDRAKLSVMGAGLSDGVPFRLNVTRSLKPADHGFTSFTLQSHLDEAAREKFSLDEVPLAGTMGVSVAGTASGAGAAQMTVSLDLGQASLALAALGWTKAKGVPAEAKIGLVFEGGRVTAIPEAELNGAGMEARFRASFGDVQSRTLPTRIEIERFTVGETDLQGTVTPNADGVWRVSLHGRSFDAGTLMKAINKDSGGAELGAIPLIIEAKLDRVVLGPDRVASGVSGQVYSDGVHFQAASLDARLQNGRQIRLRFGKVAGQQSLRLSTDDFGGVLSLFDISKNVIGGGFEFSGVVSEEAGHPVLRGDVKGTDYRVVGAPLFARLLAVTSFSGWQATLNGEGLPFSTLRAEVVLDQGRLGLANLGAYGGPLGINLHGMIDDPAGTLDLSGTLVPFYGVNSFLGKIPVLGDLLLGGEGQGIFGANFRVAGPIADPKISVNPLSALAPGALRRLFLFEPGDPAPQ